ncbi:TBC-domain-containing protein [Hyaloscypha variabilis F]|uniref:TBC-domain-containing protein n=1 Tax=Hyaloscypha variabilis (strain UAMH 11265 / GT02V1 / F) TaxID=1149755 RepID=A0A2J6RAU5_HYAVF|nr:TBC-domain-containing protein [Hyaloscypha variabilis F]
MAFSNLHDQAFAFKQEHITLLRPITTLNLCDPAITEAAFVSCHSDAYFTTVRRLSSEDSFIQYKGYGDYEKAMDYEVGPAALERTASHHSNASGKSSRSQTVRIKPRKYASYMSSSASSISDKSLTSFPSFSPESPRDERPLVPKLTDGTANNSRTPSDPVHLMVESLTTSSSLQNRVGLFDDAPLPTQRVPGAIHHANDEHIERLIARNGAVTLVRQIAEDLAQRDAQIASIRRKAETRERALRKIILECGLSNLDLETRLRAIEGEQKSPSESIDGRHTFADEGGLEDLMNDAMSETVVLGERGLMSNDATIRAADTLRALESRSTGTQRGWKDYIWGGTSRKSSRASSANGDSGNGIEPATVRTSASAGRKSIMQNGLFQPPDTVRSPSRASGQSVQAATSNRDRKASSGLATLALKLVAGTTMTSRDVVVGSGNRGRANSTGTTPPGRTPSAASVRTTMSARPATVKPVPKAIPGTRRTTASMASGQGGPLRVPQERWDTMGTSPQGSTSTLTPENFGPVEMDTILPLEAQPPTLTQIYNNHYDQEYLTDRFGFIYDQRRKKRQREAEKMQKSKRNSRVEMLSSSRSGMSIDLGDATLDAEDERPDTPASTDERGEDGKPAKRWQDYLKIATFPTELLSHTPSGGIPAFEVMEGGEVPRSPGITTEERGFLPSASPAAARPAIPVTSGNATISTPDTSATLPSSDLTSEDTEPVKILLKQLGEVHDSLQREKTVRWNDFLRKVRAERKRDGEAAAAAAALAATSNSRSERPVVLMPEVTLADGEMIGVAGLGNKGKVGRAKWNEFKALVLGGIPVAYRAKIWAECSGAAARRIPGYYDDLVAQRGEDDDVAIVSQIQMDINRTLTDNIFFRKGPGVTKLNEVLLAYSRRNAEVGYCQGMNLITACLLLIMPTAEDAFWMLTCIIESICPRGYYDHSLLASRADQLVLRRYVAEILPKLSAHLDDLGIELEALTFQWFLSVFTDCLSAEALFRVWDVVFCTNDGSTFLFQVALALLKLNETQLLQCSTPAGVYTYINHQMTNHAISIDGLIHASEGLRKVVKRDEVENRRAKAIEAEKDLIRQREEKNAIRRAARLAASNGTILDPAKESSETSSPVQNDGDEIVDEGNGELTVRTPIPVEEEIVLGLG